MIIDNVKSQGCYPYGDAWSTAFKYLETLNLDTSDGKYEIKNNDIYAVIASYETKSRHKFETHREYIDIQCLLKGEECLEYTPSKELVVESDYDAEKDVELYERTENIETSVPLKPGIFVALFCREPHMPGITAKNSPMKVKKVVIKIRAKLLDM
ncbi:YhcH/YjgK/YiaL family protein [Candidatus Auribacterota bacterium]